MPIWECVLEFWSGYISCAFQPVPEADSVILMRFDPGKVQMLQCVVSTLAVRKIQSSPWTLPVSYGICAMEQKQEWAIQQK